MRTERFGRLRPQRRVVRATDRVRPHISRRTGSDCLASLMSGQRQLSQFRQCSESPGQSFAVSGNPAGLSLPSVLRTTAGRCADCLSAMLLCIDFPFRIKRTEGMRGAGNRPRRDSGEGEEGSGDCPHRRDVRTMDRKPDSMKSPRTGSG